MKIKSLVKMSDVNSNWGGGGGGLFILSFGQLMGLEFAYKLASPEIASIRYCCVGSGQVSAAGV